MIKSILSVIIVIIMAIVLLNSKNVTDIEGIDTSVTLNHGESIEFNPIAVAKDGLDYEVTYEIEDEDIAYVKDDKIYGKSVGKTIMTLSADDYTEDVEIVVEKAEVKKAAAKEGLHLLVPGLIAVLIGESVVAISCARCITIESEGKKVLALEKRIEKLEKQKWSLTLHEISVSIKVYQVKNKNKKGT